MTQHAVSTWALDVYFAEGCPTDDAIAEHVRACAACRAYLDELARLSAEPARPLPALAPPRSSAVRLLRFVAPAAAIVAAAAAVVIYVAKPPSEDAAGYVGVKGTPAAQLIVRHEGQTRIWDGRSPIASGDALAIRVACEGFTRIAVAAPRASTWTRAFDEDCPKGATTLPFTLVADDAPGDERLAIVFSMRRLDDDALVRTAAGNIRSREAWAITFVVPKRAQKP